MAGSAGRQRVDGRMQALAAGFPEARCNARIAAEVCHNPINYSFCLRVCHVRGKTALHRNGRRTQNSIRIPMFAAADAAVFRLRRHRRETHPEIQQTQ
jgi:hypothetical protein